MSSRVCGSQEACGAPCASPASLAGVTTTPLRAAPAASGAAPLCPRGRMHGRLVTSQSRLRKRAPLAPSTRHWSAPRLTMPVLSSLPHAGLSPRSSPPSLMLAPHTPRAPHPLPAVRFRAGGAKEISRFRPWRPIPAASAAAGYQPIYWPDYRCRRFVMLKPLSNGGGDRVSTLFAECDGTAAAACIG